MQRLELDDTNSLIGYSGAWTALRGSSRQWNSTIHSTTAKGMSAAINFQGTRVVVYCTIPIGSGTDVLATVTLDGHTISFSHSTNSSAIYANILFDSGPISDTPHTVTLTNAGSTTDSPLQFDRFHLEGTVFNVSPLQASIISVGPTPTVIGPTNTGMPPTTTIVRGPAQGPTLLSLSGPAFPTSPNLSPPASASSTGAVFMTITDSNGGSEVVSLPQDFKATTGSTGNNAELQPTKFGISAPFSSYLVTTTKADGTVVTEVVDSPRIQSTATSARVPKGAIIGCVIGVITSIILVICLLVRRHNSRRSRNRHILLNDEGTPELTRVTPFNLADRSTESISASSATHTHPHDVGFARSEKYMSSSTDAHPNVAPQASTQTPIEPGVNQNTISSLPRLTFEYGNEAYVIVPRQYASPASASSPDQSVRRPDTPSSVHSTAALAMHSLAVLLPALPGAPNDLPPSYQAAG